LDKAIFARSLLLPSTKIRVMLGLLLSYLLIVWITSPTAYAASPASTFVGSDKCNQCHQVEHSQWQLSDHSRAMRRPDDKTVLGNFDEVSVEFHGIESRLFRQGNNFMVATTGNNGIPGTFAIEYTFGHYPVQQYLIDIGNGHLQALNIAWDSRPAEQGGQRWYHLQNDEAIDPEHPFFWTRHFQNANSRCIECHSTDFRKNYDPESKAYATTWTETGVGCESCHGPAARHVELAKTGGLNEKTTGFSKPLKTRLNWTFRGEDDIASPSGTLNHDYIDTCGGCHSRRGTFGDVAPQAAYHDQYRLALLDSGLYFGDGQIDDEVFVLGSFLQSKMQQRGVTCANCHDPHSGKTIAEGNALCAQCHQPATFDSSDHHRHPPGSAGAECVNCHMPERLYMGVDWRRDHGFSIPDPALASRVGAPNACTNCHQDKSDEWAIEIVFAWGGKRKTDSWARINRGLEQQDALVFKNYAQTPPMIDLPPIRRASLTSKLAAFPSQLAFDTASRQLTSTDPLERRAAVGALSAAPLQVRWPLLQPLIEDPVKAVRLELAPALAEALPQVGEKDAERLQRLLDEYRGYLEYISDTPGGQLSLGNLEIRLGYPILAERAYRQALEIEPHFVPALINLADLYRSIGSDGEAKELLLQALEVAPDSALTNHAWGLFLVRSGMQSEAMGYLKAAIELEGANPRHVYVYAVALDSLGQTSAAIQVIDANRERWPNNIDLSFLQVSYMDKTGNSEGIHRYLSLLAAIAAGNPQVRNWMSKYGG
jgi:predicted CXXCH cytochrome family protein